MVLAAAAALDKAQSKIEKKEVTSNTKKSEKAVGDSVGNNLFGAPDFDEEGVDLTFALDNPIFSPLTRTTSIDYNGLLFSPRALPPGQSAKGLLFFKAKGMDWSALNLQASLR